MGKTPYSQTIALIFQLIKEQPTQSGSHRNTPSQSVDFSPLRLVLRTAYQALSERFSVDCTLGNLGGGDY
jgi:hypothetical protein